VLPDGDGDTFRIERVSEGGFGHCQEAALCRGGVFAEEDLQSGSGIQRRKIQLPTDLIGKKEKKKREGSN